VLGEELQRATALRRQAGALDNPELSFETERPRGTARQSTWSLAWTPPLDGRRGLRVEAAEAAVLSAGKRLESRRLRLRLELRQAFADWYVAETRKGLFAEQALRVEALVAWLRARADSGEASRLEQRRLALELSQLHKELAEATARGEVARATVAGWVGCVTPQTRPERPSLPETPDSLDVSSRPDLAALGHELQRRTLERRLGGRLLAAPAVFVGWQEVTDNGVRFEGPVAGFEWTIPILDRGQGRRGIAEARLAAAQARIAVATTRAQARLAGALEGYRTLRRAALSATSQVSDAPIVVEGATAAFRLGEAGLTDLLDTLRAALGARLSELDLIDRALAAGRELEAASGQALTERSGS
jgi:cobalt-zinc-cadmium efflux system outer membrane protein